MYISEKIFHSGVNISDTLDVENNIWISPKRLYAVLAIMLNGIVAETEPDFCILHSDLNRFVCESNRENFELLQKNLKNHKENGLRAIVIKLFGIYPLILNMAIKTALIHSEINNKKNTKICEFITNPIKMHLGLYGKETEPSSEELIYSLSEISDKLENFANMEDIQKLMRNVWVAASSVSNFNEVTMQLFYANQIYWNFNKVIKEIQSKIAFEKIKHIDLGEWLDCYTWLTTDRDGRPHDTNEKTENLIQILEASIRSNYIKELKEISLLMPDIFINKIISRIPKHAVNTYTSPLMLINDLESIKSSNYLVSELIIKIKIFGFHFLKLEFRDNSKMLEEVIETLLDPKLIEKFLDEKNKNYQTLNRNQKIKLLTKLLHPSNESQVAKIKVDYLAENMGIYQEKKAFHKNIDYIELIDIDPDYIKQVNVESTLGRFALMAAYPDRLHVHAIAETSGPEDALALLFLAKLSVGHTRYIDVALQPEDSGGAVTIIDMVKVLYRNSAYRAHLKNRNDKQYIIFGPSDTGKQGGKAMHLANMQIAQIHRIIANDYNINPIIHVIVGYEHARCNGCLDEILDGYGTLNQTESEYMMAGLNEMRSQLLTPKQVTGFLSNLYFTHAKYQPVQNSTIEQKQKKSQFWLKIVARYQRFFHNHPCLPQLLRKIARFDIINATAKGTRPPSRILNTKNLEDYPVEIRAIPWSRSFLLAGIHAEVIGPGHLAKLPAKKLHHLYLTEVDFQRYVHHIIYGVARTDMNFAWKTAGEKRPNRTKIKNLAKIFEAGKEKLSDRHMLAWIDYEIGQANRFAYKAVHGITPIKHINKMQLLQYVNPALFEEVSWRNNLFIFHKALLVKSRFSPEMLKEKYVKDLFTGALTICNTSLSMLYPHAANTLNWKELSR